MSQYVEKELLKLSGARTISDAVRQLFQEFEQPVSIDTNDKWIREHADYYSLKFTLSNRNESADYKFKACVEYAPSARDVEELVERWVARNSRLIKFGVDSTEIIAAGNGVTLEPDKGLAIEDYFKNNSDHNMQESGVRSLSWVHASIVTAGFPDVVVRSAVRFFENRPVVCEFGSSLGGHHNNPEMERVVQRVDEICAHLKNFCDDSLISQYRSVVMNTAYERKHS